MSDHQIKRALISVYDKTGIVEFARGLIELGIELISTGGTAELLKKSAIPVTLVEEITGFPEMLDGRVKTLHPKIHAAILADRDNPEHMRQLAEQGIEPIDMVVVNLYPFEKTVADPECTVEQTIEMIDIGGPCLLRAAAKNHKHVWPISSRYQYAKLLQFLDDKSEEALDRKRRSDARIAFLTTWTYDRQITAFLEREYSSPTSSALDIHLELPTADQFERLRYGENPHQSAELRSFRPERQSVPVEEPIIAEMVEHGGMSFNNYLDADAALALCAELTRSCPSRSAVVFIKHTNPCGVGISDDRIESLRRAYLGDLKAAMGGILAIGFPLDALFAQALVDALDRWGKAAGASAFFAEVIVAPWLEEGAEPIIRTRKEWGQRVRLLSVGVIDATPDCNRLDCKRISGGMLVQTRDLVGVNEEHWKVVTKRQPTESEMSDLRLAWLIAKHTKSNAISICREGMLIGNGAGQASRVMSCRVAAWLAEENGHGDKLEGAVAASDGFFPFRDGPDLLIQAGVRAIIQPGGSKRDDEVIAACDEHDVAMIFTATRHFKH